MINDSKHLFMYLLAIYMALEKNVFLGLLPIFLLCFLMLSYMSCFYILGINLLLVILFANIFSYSMGCLFVLLMVFFAVQTFKSNWV